MFFYVKTTGFLYRIIYREPVKTGGNQARGDKMHLDHKQTDEAMGKPEEAKGHLTHKVLILQGQFLIQDLTII